jgi:hypothetical protein
LRMAYWPCFAVCPKYFEMIWPWISWQPQVYPSSSHGYGWRYRFGMKQPLHL